MTSKADVKVSKYYNTVGWDTVDGVTVDAREWEDLRECANGYISKCRFRVLKHIPIRGDFDCTVSLHTIYHMDKDKQEQAVENYLLSPSLYGR